MSKNNKTSIITSSIVCLIPILFGVIVYNQLPDVMATHWGLSGNANGFMPKGMAVFGLPVFLCILNLVLQIASGKDDTKFGGSKAFKGIMLGIIPVLSVIVNSFVILWNLDYKLPIANLAVILCGLLFLLIGNYMPKTRQNTFVGIRISWTLNSEENWKKTHTKAGKLWFICGLATLILGFFPLSLPIGILIILIFIVMVAYPVYYSYKLHQQGI